MNSQLHIKPLSKFLFPPAFANQDLTQKARLIYYLLMPLFLVSTILGILGLVRSGSLADGVGISLASGLFFLFMLWQIHRGKISFPSYLIPAVILLATVSAAIDDGDLAPRHITSFFLGIIITSVLLDETAIIIFGVISLIPITLIPYFASSGFISQDNQPETLLTRLTIISGVWLVAIFLLRFVVKNFRASANNAQESAAKLKEQNSELQKIHLQLENRSNELSALNTELQIEIGQREIVSQALTQSQAFSQHILNAIPDLIVRLHYDGTITEIKKPTDEHTFQLLEIDESWEGQNLGTYLPPEIKTSWLNKVQQSIEEQIEITHEYQADLEGVNPASYEGRILPINDNEAILIIRDTTRQRQEEQANRRSQRLESIGVLAGGIAHDFNNLLTGILGQTSLAKVKINRNIDPIENIDRAILAAERAADLTRQLLAYSGKGQFIIELIDANNLIKESVFLLETLFAKNVHLEINYSEAPAIIEADKGQIQQVILNIIINASDAMKAASQLNQPATITLNIDPIQMGANPIGNNFIGQLPQEGDYIAISISDNGPGISKENISRIFEPYFSTKGPGRGLGLSATLGIIHRLSGAIELESREGEGAHFTVYFPKVDSALKQPTHQTQTLHLENTGRVLIVDDEESVRGVATGILQELGFETLEAIDGLKGVNLFETHQKSINFILLDMQMPVMNGAETLSKIRSMDPKIKIILSSGYSERDLIKESNDDNLFFLQKPYKYSTLQKLLQSLSLLPN